MSHHSRPRYPHKAHARDLMDEQQVRKICFKCNQEKPLSEFYRHPRMADGHLNKCKDCTKHDVARHREDNIDAIREYDRQRGRTAERIALNTARTARYRKDHPDRYAAHRQAGRAAAIGRIAKATTCEVCGNGGRLEKHHPNYDEPLLVVFLCPACHRGVHHGKVNLTPGAIRVRTVRKSPMDDSRHRPVTVLAWESHVSAT